MEEIPFEVVVTKHPVPFSGFQINKIECCSEIHAETLMEDVVISITRGGDYHYRCIVCLLDMDLESYVFAVPAERPINKAVTLLMLKKIGIDKELLREQVKAWIAEQSQTPVLVSGLSALEFNSTRPGPATG